MEYLNVTRDEIDTLLNDVQVEVEKIAFYLHDKDYERVSQYTEQAIDKIEGLRAMYATRKSTSER